MIFLQDSKPEFYMRLTCNMENVKILKLKCWFYLILGKTSSRRSLLTDNFSSSSFITVSAVTMLNGVMCT